MTTNHQLNQRANALNRLKRDMAKKGFEFKKIVKNRCTFWNPETRKKERMVLEV